LSLSQAGRVATYATEDRRQALVERFVERLSMVVLSVAMLYIFVGDAPFDRSGVDRSADISPVNRYVWLSLLALTVPILWVRLRPAIRLALAAWPMLVLFGWFALTTQWALDHDASVRRVLVYVVFLVVAFAALLGAPRRHAAHLTLALCAGAVVLVDVGSWPIVPGLAMTDLGFAGMHPQKNLAGEVSLFALLASATCLPFVRRRSLRILLFAIVVAAPVELVASRSATSISLGVGLVILAPLVTRLLRGPPIGLAVAGSLLLSVPAAALLAYLAWAGLTDHDPMAPLRGVTLTERTDLWSFLIENIHQRPLLGSGFGSFWAIDPAVQPSLQTGLWFSLGNDVANQGHDAYLDITAATGLIGLAMVLCVQLRAIVLAGLFVRRGGSVFPLAFLLIVSIHSFTESSLFTPNNMFGDLFVLLAVWMEQERGRLLFEKR